MKYITRLQLVSFILLISLFAGLSITAQTHTPKYVSMTSKTKAYYEYLPEAYNPGGTATYPLLLFITGIGEFGDGSAAQLPYVLKNGPPKIIQAGAFPKSFVVGGQTHRFIVITPQFLKGSYPKAADIDAVLNYIVTHYKVNASRIYLTGLSYGGGSSWAYPGDNATFAKRIAGTAPVAGAAPASGGDSIIYARSRIMAANNVPVWAFHNSGDLNTPVDVTNSYISYINKAPAPTPLAKKTIFNIGGHDAWTKAYDPLYRENNLNMYEWMLQYQRPPQVTVKKIQVNVYGGANAYTDVSWNNWNVGTVNATNVSSTAFKYSSGTASTVTATLSATTAVSDNGTAYGSGMAPAEVLRYSSNATILRTLTLKGLSTAKTYNLEFYASRSTSTAASTVFTVNGTAVTINVVNNLTNKAVFNNIAPNSSGQIVVSINKTATYNYLNGFTVTENEGTPPPAGTKYVRVNVYGGTNAYANTGWNNWNVGTTAATNKTITALKYSDGVASALSATLSTTSAIGDNGTTYGSGMAPAEVLRYSSNATVLRTLTIGGLSGTKKYSIELYASRNSSTAGSTVFTVNGISQTINVVNNLTNKASFSNLTPNSAGQIVVSINKTATYNYLNGFTVTESGTTSTTTSVNAGGAGVETLATAQGQLPGGQAVNVFPNPAASQALLTLNNPYTGALRVQIADAGGRSLRELRFVKNITVMQQPLSLAGLQKGLYFITVNMGTQRQTIKVFKL